MDFTLNDIRIVCFTLFGTITFLLIILPRYVTKQKIFSQARWMMASATVLFCIHFVLQFILQRHQEIQLGMRSTINLLFFMPASYFLNISLLYLMRNGKIFRHEWLLGPIIYGVAIIFLFIKWNSEDKFGVHISHETYIAVTLMGILYYVLLIYYNWLRLREYFKLRKKLSEYYDESIYQMIEWFKWSIPVLALSALFAPAICFVMGNSAKYYALCVTLAIFYYAFQFICYGVGKGVERVNEAILYSTQLENKIVTTEKKLVAEFGLSPNEIDVINNKINTWQTENTFANNNITIVAVSKMLGISVGKMRLWLKEKNFGTFAQFISHLRIEYAKTLLKNNPVFSIDAIAEMSGFGNHSNFIRAFKRDVGLTPNEWRKLNLK